MVIFENINIDKGILENIDIEIDIDKTFLKKIDIDIDKAILENIDIDIDRAVLEYIDIDKEFRKISIRRFQNISISIKYRID